VLSRAQAEGLFAREKLKYQARLVRTSLAFFIGKSAGNAKAVWPAV